ALAVVDVENVHLLVLADTGDVEQPAVDRARTFVMQFGIGDGGTVDLGLEQGQMHGVGAPSPPILTRFDAVQHHTGVIMPARCPAGIQDCRSAGSGPGGPRPVPPGACPAQPDPDRALPAPDRAPRHSRRRTPPRAGVPAPRLPPAVARHPTPARRAYPAAPRTAAAPPCVRRPRGTGCANSSPARRPRAWSRRPAPP